MKLAHALNRFFKPMVAPYRLARELVAPNDARPNEELAERLDGRAVHSRRRERFLALALDRMGAPPCDQTRHVGVRNFVKALVGAEVLREDVKRVPRSRAVAMVLANLFPVAAGRVA